VEPLLLRARNPSAWTGPTGNNTYLLRGAVPTLIDAGVGDPRHVEEIAQALNGAPLLQVLITHGHPDHVAGLPALRHRWGQISIFEGTFENRDLTPISAGDGEVVAVHTPGHSPDHCCFLDRESGDMYCGDLARLGGTIVIPASRGGSLRQYLESLQRVRALGPRRLLPGHGPIVDDPVALLDSYIVHRAEREAQIVAAIREGAFTPEEIVPRVYGTLEPGIEKAAAESVLAHLVKLEEEGGARRDPEGRWQCP
jgi:glyoxylase-like metal-dependent hydrolase (beta-lactamase superfamily II)